ncbi:hypothetical protein AB0J72_19940 [Dactylosporangium sp. NPDC049742]
MEYLSAQETGTTAAEVTEAHAEAQSIVEAATKLLPHLSFF